MDVHRCGFVRQRGFGRERLALLVLVVFLGIGSGMASADIVCDPFPATTTRVLCIGTAPEDNATAMIAIANGGQAKGKQKLVGIPIVGDYYMPGIAINTSGPACADDGIAVSVSGPTNHCPYPYDPTVAGASGTGGSTASTLAVSGTGDANGMVAVSGNGCATGDVAISLACANGQAIAIGGTGNATAQTFAVSGTGTASAVAPFGIAASGMQCASGNFASSGTGCANGVLIGVSGTQCAAGTVAASGIGCASGHTTISGLGCATGTFAFSGTCASGSTATVVGMGDASASEWAVSGTGCATATNPGSSIGAAIGGSCANSAGLGAISGTSDARGGLIGISGLGNAYGNVALSGYGDAGNDSCDSLVGFSMLAAGCGTYSNDSTEYAIESLIPLNVTQPPSDQSSDASSNSGYDPDCWGKSHNPHRAKKEPEVSAKSRTYCKNSSVAMLYVESWLYGEFGGAFREVDHDWRRVYDGQTTQDATGDLRLSYRCAGLGLKSWLIESYHLVRYWDGSMGDVWTANMKKFKC